MKKVEDIDYLLEEGEVILVKFSEEIWTGQKNSDTFSGLYKVTDVMRGDRTQVSVQGIDPWNSAKTGALNQKHMEDNFTVYRLSILEDPEYFL